LLPKSKLLVVVNLEPVVYQFMTKNQFGEFHLWPLKGGKEKKYEIPKTKI